MNAITPNIPAGSFNGYFKRDAWKKVLAENPTWFSPAAMSFWNCEVAWLSIHPVGANNYLFVTRENNFDGSARLFSVREAINGGGIHTHDFQTFETIEEALEQLWEYVQEEQRVSGIQQVW